MRRWGAARLVFAVVTGVLLGADTAALGLSQDWASRLEGWWDEGDPAEVCAAGRVLHRKTWLPDQGRLTHTYAGPKQIYDGRVVDRVSYRVLQADGDTLTLFLEGETRRRRSGELLIWQLVVVEPGAYRWRLATEPPARFNDVWGIRCDGR